MDNRDTYGGNYNVARVFKKGTVYTDDWNTDGK